MSKLAHSNQETMDALEFLRLREEGVIPQDYAIAAKLHRLGLLPHSAPEKQRQAAVRAYLAGFEYGFRFEP